VLFFAGLAFDFEEVLFFAGLAFDFEEVLFFAGFLFLVPPMKSSLYARGNGLGSGEYPVDIGAAAYFNIEFGMNSLVLLKIRNKSADFPSG
jgi:hypothetical protein